MKYQTALKIYYLPTALIALLFMAAVSMASDFKPVSSNAGRVRVDVVPLQLAAGKAASFEVRLTTHSVELSQDLKLVSILRDDQGHEYTPLQWEGDPPGGHHRKGVLVFPELKAPVTSVTLTIRDVSNVASREFAWKLIPK